MSRAASALDRIRGLRNQVAAQSPLMSTVVHLTSVHRRTTPHLPQGEPVAGWCRFSRSTSSRRRQGPRRRWFLRTGNVPSSERPSHSSRSSRPIPTRVSSTWDAVRRPRPRPSTTGWRAMPSTPPGSCRSADRVTPRSRHRHRDHRVSVAAGLARSRRTRTMPRRSPPSSGSTASPGSRIVTDFPQWAGLFAGDPSVRLVHPTDHAALARAAGASSCARPDDAGDSCRRSHPARGRFTARYERLLGG